MRPTVEELVSAIGLELHSEGGVFRETYRAEEVVETPRGRRAACTAILFLVTAAVISRLHRLSSDELWVFQGGLPLEFVTLGQGGESARHVLGDAAEPDSRGGTADRSSGGMAPQVLVPAGYWQGARLADGVHLPTERAWSLVSCVVTPGFEYEDFELGRREALLDALPQHEETHPRLHVAGRCGAALLVGRRAQGRRRGARPGLSCPRDTLASGWLPAWIRMVGCWSAAASRNSRTRSRRACASFGRGIHSHL